MNNHTTSPPKSSLLGRLRTAVNKLRFLLQNLPSFSSSSWPAPLVSALIRSHHQPRRLNLSDRRPSGLTDACEFESAESEEYYEARSSASSSTASTPSGRVLHRTASCPQDSSAAGDEEIDAKAEDFIAKFYRQLRLEKQNSLELRYCRGHSFGSSSPQSPYSNLSLASPPPPTPTTPSITPHGPRSS